MKEKILAGRTPHILYMGKYLEKKVDRLFIKYNIQPQQEQPSWLSWLSWLNPFSYIPQQQPEINS